MDWNHVDYLWIIVLFFISCLVSHSDGNHYLRMIHWWASETNSSTFWMAWRQVHFQQISIVGWTISFIQNLTFQKNYFKALLKAKQPKKIPFRNKLL